MQDILVLGDITDSMQSQLDRTFISSHWFDQPAEQRLDWLSEQGARFAYVLTNGHDGLPVDAMALMPNLKLISSYGVGYDAIDTNETNKRGILVAHTPDVLNAEVATTAVMLMLASLRRLRANEDHVRSGAWNQGNAPLSRTADGRHVGLLGMGRIGQAIARKLEAFDAHISYHCQTPKDLPYTYCTNLVEMAASVEVLICITPGGPSTEGLVGREVLRALGPDGLLINVARGSVVDEAALVEALQSGELGAAALDVFEREPLVPDALKTMNQVLLTPHIGSATVETRAAMGQLTIDNLVRHQQGKPLISPVPECKGLL